MPPAALAGIVPGLWIGTVAGAAMATRLPAQTLRVCVIVLLVSMAALMGLRALS